MSSMAACMDAYLLLPLIASAKSGLVTLSRFGLIVSSSAAKNSLNLFFASFTMAAFLAKSSRFTSVSSCSAVTRKSSCHASIISAASPM
ncbi:MAG: hypothetical protein ACD_23C00213G0001, partial [uncultured bacterium]